MKTILSSLDSFCKGNGIEYMITGTAALSLLGVPSRFKPQDIDIKVFNLTNEQTRKLSELQYLSGLDNSGYKDISCYAFYIHGVKINAIISDSAEMTRNNALLIDFDGAYTAWVQKVEFALADKMKLNRPKDTCYMLDLISNLSKI